MKPRKNQVTLLDEAITILEYRRHIEYQDLKVQFHETAHNFKPINIFNQTVKDFRELPEVKTNLLETLISVAGGYFSKKLVVGKSSSFVKNILGNVLQYAVTNFISKKVSTDSEE